MRNAKNSERVKMAAKKLSKELARKYCAEHIQVANKRISQAVRETDIEMVNDLLRRAQQRIASARHSLRKAYGKMNKGMSLDKYEREEGYEVVQHVCEKHAQE